MLALSTGCARSQEIDLGPPGECRADELCDGHTGACAPASLCTTSEPCEEALVGGTRQTVTEPMTLPFCRTSVPSRAVFDDGPPMRWRDDVLGVDRAACVFAPVANDTRRPLIVFFHGSGGSADAIYNATSLRRKAESFRWPNGATGFVLASHQGLNQASHTGYPPASRHSIEVRDFSSSSRNPDVRAVDRLIDTLVERGAVDPQQIHVFGWSNGGAFAQLYGIFRNQQPTPGGHRVAAVAVFDGPNPLSAPNTELPGCAYSDPLTTSLAVYSVHRNCSIVPCDPAQNRALGGVEGADLTLWLRRFEVGLGAAVANVTIDADGAPASCAPLTRCGVRIATQNHLRWPDGVADGGGRDYEQDMLTFVGQHPLR